MSQDFHQPAFEIFQLVHGSTGPEKLNWVWTDFCPFCSGAAPDRRAKLDGMPTLTLFCWYVRIWENPDVVRPFLLSSGLQILSQTKRKEQEFRVQIHHMRRICLWPVSTAVVSVVLFCKLLITSPFVHFCGPDHVLPSYFYYSCITVRQKRFQQSSQLLLWFKVRGIVYSTAIYTTQLVFSDSDEWVILYSVWKRNDMVLYLSF